MKNKASRFVPAALATVFVITALGASSASAAIFMRVGNIVGESLDPFHKNWIDLDSADWGISVTLSDEGSRPQVVLDDFSWTQDADRSYPQLIEAITAVWTLPRVVVHWTRDSSSSISTVLDLEMVFDDVVLTNLDLASTASTQTKTVSGTFTFEALTATYYYPDPFSLTGQGQETASYDKRTGEGSLAALSALYAAGSVGAELTAVPLPAAGWLLGSAVLGLVGVSRRRRAEG
jgi:type VI protein secretion system component Hcp